QLISRENGKTLQEAISMELMSVADLATYFAKRAERILAPRSIPLHLLKHKASYVHYRPRGVVLVISPWNFPFSIPFGEICMALMAGNAVVLKPASLTPLIAVRAAKLFHEAGLDPALLEVVTAPGRVASTMVESGKVDYVNFTGSVPTGKRVSEVCGRMLIPCSMELGGKDAL
ncbi:MAG: aldehyde dehydrogenase family protein, partial [Pseudomonadales bacterium]|nr:aldehyde dehydrogenase family protein [Pseudomonadales bacterium]